MGAIEFNQRVLALGKTRSGKSVLLNMLASGLIRGRGAQVFLIDSKPEYELPGVTPVSDVAEVDWTQPVIHYKTAAPSTAEVQRLFSVLEHRRRMTVIVHEAIDLCEASANKVPAALDRYLSKGAGFGIGMWAGTQRPVGLPVRLLTESEHVFVFATWFTKKADKDAAAEAMGMDVRELDRHMQQLKAEHGQHAFLHFDRIEGTVTACPPLRDAERKGIIVQSPTLY